MAQPEYDNDDQMVDTDELPDGVDPAPSRLPLFENLDQGNLIEKTDSLPGGPQQIASDAIQVYERAKSSMDKWTRRYEQALKLAKLTPEAAHKTFPFDGASVVMMPFILEAMLDFHGRASPELVWRKNVVAMRSFGAASGEKDKRGERAAQYLNYQVLDQMKWWRREQDKMLLSLPCVGTAYKLVRWNADTQQVDSNLYMADQVVFEHTYSTFDDAPDKFIMEEYTRNEVIGFVRGDAQWRLEEDTLEQQRDHPEPFKFLRGWTWVDLDQDGLTEPYEVVIREDTQALVYIAPAYDEEGITTNQDGETVEVEMADMFTQYQFLPDPEGGPMGLGWGVLLCDLFLAINTSVRQMIDAGTLANLAGNSGLIDAQMSGQSARGNRQQAGPIEVRMGELTPISTGGKPLGQSVVQFPYQGPNTVLYQLTEYMVEQVRAMTNSALDMDSNTQEAAAMYLARLQQGLKVPNSIVMRVYSGAQEEFALIGLLNHKHYDDQAYNKVIDASEPHSMAADFDPDDCDIRTAVDPSQGSDIERQQRADMVLQEAKEQPQQVINLRQAYLDWLEAFKVPDVEALAPEPSGEPDPMQQMVVANMQRQAELDERRMKLDEAESQLKRAELMLKARDAAAKLGIDQQKAGLDADKAEAEITKIYTDAIKTLWEIGAAGDNPIRTVQQYERAFIDRQPTGEAPPVPLDSPDPNPQPQEVVGEQ